MTPTDAARDKPALEPVIMALEILLVGDVFPVADHAGAATRHESTASR